MVFLNALFNSVVLYIIFGLVALGAALLGITLRKKKNAKEGKEN